MLPINVLPPQAILRQIGASVKARRLAADWSRQTLSARSGIPAETIKRLELTGNIGLAALIQIAIALDAAQEFSALFPAKPIVSLADVKQRNRQRGSQ